MELIIKEAEKKPKIVNCYDVAIEFMEGDADGTEYHTIRFKESLLENKEFKKELEDFLICVNACIEKDNRGRGGFEDPSDLIKEYKEIKNWAKYCADALDNIEDEYDEEDYQDEFGLTKEDLFLKNEFRQMFLHYVPSYSEGWYDSYRKLHINYYDSNGDKFPVEIKF